MSKNDEPLEEPQRPGAQRVEFEVDNYGTLLMANFAKKNTRDEIYGEDVPGTWAESPQDLVDAMDVCKPLALEVHSIYEELREEIERDLQNLTELSTWNKRRATALKARLRALPEDAEKEASNWLLSLTCGEFKDRIIPMIDEWFSGIPDSRFEDIPESATAQGAALEFFREMSADDVEKLGIEIVEGENPGSTYYAAELRGDIEDANRSAEAAGIAVHFKMYGSDV